MVQNHLTRLSSRAAKAWFASVKLGALPVVGTVLVVPALIASATDRWGLALLLGLIPAAWIYAGFYFLGRSDQVSRWGGVGTPSLVPRALLLVVLALVARSLDLSLGGYLAIAAIALGLSLEPAIEFVASKIQPVAANLPGFEWRNYPRINPVSVPVAAISWYLVAGITLAFRPQLWWLLLLLGSATLAFGTGCFLYFLRRYSQQKRQTPRLIKALGGYQPQFIFHWEAPKNTTYQVKMWLPYLERLEVPFVLVARTQVNYEELLTLTTRPVILRHSIGNLDSVIAPSVRAVVYVNTATVNNHMVRYTHLTHIQLNHGESDKAASYNPAFKMFTKNLVAGQAAVDRFARNGISTPPDFFEIVGRPQIEDISVGASPDPGQRPRTVLYAPTWHGFYEDSNYCSLPIGLDLVKELHGSGHQVIFRPHPYSMRSAKYAGQVLNIVRYLQTMNLTQGASHVFGPDADTPPITALMNKSDALISDVSSVVADYLYSEKPFAIVCINQTRERLLETMPIAAASYILDAATALADRSNRPAFRSAVGTVQKAFFTADTLLPERLSLKQYYLGDIPYLERATRFLTVLTGLLATKTR